MPRPLTEARVQEATGETHLRNAMRLDIIFEPITGDLEGLHGCTNLRELCLIDTPGLTSIPALSFAPHLTRLTLTDQRITSLTAASADGLGYLPNLRELYLHNNRLRHTGGLAGCVGLQKLWLCSNQILQLQHMDSFPNLRELWVQNNCLQRVAPPNSAGRGGSDAAGLCGCLNLQVLAAAGNPLADCEAIGLHTLAELPALHDLSFTDPMFGQCPVVDIPDYRDTVILECRQLQTLDGVAVDSHSRLVAEDGHLRSALEFDAKVEAIKQAAAAETAAAATRLTQNSEALERHKASLQAHWRTLCNSVSQARDAMAAERQRLVASIEAERTSLQQRALGFAAEYDAVVRRQLRATQQQLAAEDARLVRFAVMHYCTPRLLSS
jgi:hypothetical protein|eukprot:COSAG01_NODE_2069_length_8498_cov_5.965841_16_plen_382_part_00